MAQQLLKNQLLHLIQADYLKKLNRGLLKQIDKIKWTELHE